MVSHRASKYFDRALVFVWITLAIGMIGCRRSSGGVPLNQAEESNAAPEIQITLSAGVDPMVMGPVQWRITLLDEANRPVEGATVSIRGDMNHAGMIPVEAIATDNGNGNYAADFEWTMAGDWIVTVTARLEDGRVKSDVFEYTITTH